MDILVVVVITLVMDFHLVLVIVNVMGILVLVIQSVMDLVFVSVILLVI
jgi:hypothetical protein